MSKKKLFAVRDAKVGGFESRIILCHTQGEAIRSFADAVKDENLILSKHPQDFALFELGEMDLVDGKVYAHAQPEQVISALQVKEVD